MKFPTLALPAALFFCVFLAGCGGDGGSTTPPPKSISVSISPNTANVPLGQVQQFTATVMNASDTSVTWSVNGAAGGNSSVGTISSAGAYTAPSAVPSGTVTVSATSVADPTKSANATVTVTSGGGTVMVSVSPSTATVAVGQLQQFTATVSNASDTSVTWSVNGAPGGNSSAGTISSSGSYTAPSAVPSGAVTVTATSVADPTKSGNAMVTVSSSGSVTVSVSPSSATVLVGQVQQFTATVTNASDTSVTWSVNGTSGGNSTLGTISASGAYTAPGAVPAGSVTVTATSVADPTKSGNASVTVVTSMSGLLGMLTYHNDAAITGQNLNETILTPANVNQSLFGKLFSYPLDGQSYAQPLYVANVRIAGGTHNVAYVATEHDTVYAFDADGTASGAFWSVNFTNPAAGVTTIPAADVGGGGPIIPEVGITSTPVIDGRTGTIYVLAATKENGSYVHRLHALDISNGHEKFGGPVAIHATVPGTGADSNNGQISFNTAIQLQRSALILLNGVVYIAWASYNDVGPYHGWIMGYNASTLAQVRAWIATPNGQRGGIWMAGAPLSVDSSGNIFVIVGNGTFDADQGGVDYGDSFLKLIPNGNSFTVADYFTPFNQQTLAANDIDVGSCGLTLLPNQPGPVTHLGVSAGKEGRIYLLDRDNLGKFHAGSDSQIVQSIPQALGHAANDNDYSTATYWQGNVYFVGNGDVIKQFQLNNGLLTTSPAAHGTKNYGYPGANTSVSSNGASNGILWAIEASGVNILHAYDANDVSQEIYNSTQAGNRDNFGAAVRFSVPTVINGRVYVAGKTQFAAFGLLP
jgi:uncharacterized protein YjdB